MTESSSTELALPTELVNPLTGEIVPTRDTVQVADVLMSLKQHKQDVESAIAVFTAPLLAESKRLGAKTLELGGLTAKVSADSEIQWDIEVLLELRDLGLPESRYNELVTEVVEFKVNGSVARQLAGASAEYAEVIDRARKRIPKRQYVTVS